jgi:hypothetical protein
MSSIQTPAVTAPVATKDEMPSQDAFTQLYQSLTPIMGMATPQQDSAAMFDEWLKQDILSECSVTSSPEINTPLDQFLMSPPFTSKEVTNSSGSTYQNSPSTANYDLDVSAILDSPVTSSYALTAATPSQAPTPAATPIAQISSLFGDIGDSLPAALAALAAVAASPMTSAEMSPVTSASTPAFSASPRSRKRESDITPGDDAAVKRQKNTDAARRSRLRKVQKMDLLEHRVSELEKLNAGLLMRVAVLDSEKTNLRAKESSYETRIRNLEDQLAEAHKALARRQ